MCAGDGGQLLPTGLGWGKILKIKIEARRPEEGRMSVYEGQIKGGRATEETVKSVEDGGTGGGSPGTPLRSLEGRGGAKARPEPPKTRWRVDPRPPEAGLILHIRSERLAFHRPPWGLECQRQWCLAH